MKELEYSRKLPAIVMTGGDGYWTKIAKQVVIRGVVITHVDISDEVGEDDDGGCEYNYVQVYFDSTKWNIENDGLIYTDRTFMKNLLETMKFLGFSKENLSYSEHGMQGRDYIHFDFSPSDSFDFSKFKLDREYDSIT